MYFLLLLCLISPSIPSLSIEGLGSWTRIPPTNLQPSGRYGAGIVLYNSKIYYIDGRDDVMTYAEIWSYDLEAALWTKYMVTYCGGIQRSGRFRSSVALVGNVVWVYSGNEVDPNIAVGDMWTLNLDTMEWANADTNSCGSKGTFKIPALSRGWDYAWNGNWYFTGGQITRLLDGTRIFLNGTWQFNFVTNTWRILQTKGTPPPETLGNTGVGVGNLMYTSGGYFFSDPPPPQYLYVFNCDTYVWTQIPTSNYPPLRGAHSMAYWNNRIYVLFGYSQSIDDDLSDIWELDLGSTNLTWIEVMNPMANYPPKRDSIGPTLPTYNDKMWFFGGWGQDMYNDFWTFDYGTNQFNLLQNSTKVPQGRSQHCYTRIGPNVYIFGGETDGDQVLNDIWIFNMEIKDWQLTIPAGAPPPRKGCTMISFGNRIYLFGGAAGEGAEYNDIWIYDQISNTWQIPLVSGVVPSGRQGHMAWLRDNKMVVFGGYSSGFVQKDLWEFDLEIFSWSPISLSQTVEIMWGQPLVNQTNEFIIGGNGVTDDPHTIHQIIRTNNDVWLQEVILPGSNPVNFTSMAGGAVFYNKLMVHGGIQYNTPQVYLQLYDLENMEYDTNELFTDYNPGDQPSARYGHILVNYKQSVFAIGGYGDTYFNEVWELALNTNHLCSNSMTSENCWTCASGSVLESNMCSDCPSGTYSGGNPFECSLCPAGFYGQQLGATDQDSCTPCPETTFSDHMGNTFCSQCPSNMVCPFGSVFPLPPSEVISGLSYSSDQPVPKSVNTALLNWFTQTLWGVTGTLLGLGVLVVIISRFTHSADKVQEKMSQLDLLFDTHHRPVMINGVFIVRAAPCGGLFTLISIFLSIAFALSYIVPYIMFNEEETQTLVPNYLVWGKDTATGQWTVTLQFVNYGGSCISNPSNISSLSMSDARIGDELEVCAPGIAVTFNGMVARQNGVLVQASLTPTCIKSDSDCNVTFTCQNCGMNPNQESTTTASIVIDMEESNVYASGIGWEIYTSSSLPGKNRNSFLQGTFSASQLYVFRGTQPHQVLVRAIQSFYIDSQAATNNSGYHLEYLSSTPGSESNSENFYYSNGLHIEFLLDKAENTLYFSAVQVNDILSVIAQVLGTVSGLTAFLAVLLRVLEKIGIIDDSFVESYMETLRVDETFEDAGDKEPLLERNLHKPILEGAHVL